MTDEEQLQDPAFLAVYERHYQHRRNQEHNRDAAHYLAMSDARTELDEIEQRAKDDRVREFLGVPVPASRIQSNASDFVATAFDNVPVMVAAELTADERRALVQLGVSEAPLGRRGRPCGRAWPVPEEPRRALLKRKLLQVKSLPLPGKTYKDDHLVLTKDGLGVLQAILDETLAKLADHIAAIE